jgi:hypothetical protein
MRICCIWLVDSVKRKFTFCFLVLKGYSNYLWPLHQNTIAVY